MPVVFLVSVVIYRVFKKYRASINAILLVQKEKNKNTGAKLVYVVIFVFNSVIQTMI